MAPLRIGVETFLLSLYGQAWIFLFPFVALHAHCPCCRIQVCAQGGCRTLVFTWLVNLGCGDSRNKQAIMTPEQFLQLEWERKQLSSRVVEHRAWGYLGPVAVMAASIPASFLLKMAIGENPPWFITFPCVVAIMAISAFAALKVMKISDRKLAQAKIHATRIKKTLESVE